MSKALRNTLIGVVLLGASAVLVLTGMYISRAYWRPVAYGPGSMMSWYDSQNLDRESYRFLPGGMGYGMMGDLTPSYGMMGSGMMGSGMMGPGVTGFSMMASGMMAGSTYSPLYGIEPLSLHEAEQAVEDYLKVLGDDDLEVGEVMIFENHGYAQIVERSSGIGAMEVLIDPVTRAVLPEFGPNMMWNLKYGHMAGAGMVGMMGMMGGTVYPSDLDAWGFMMAPRQSADLPEEMPISEEEAVKIAQRYLETSVPGAQADDHADRFYGYYTLHILREGETVGMLSVNGYSGQVFVHTWHGTFVEMSESH